MVEVKDIEGDLASWHTRKFGPEVDLKATFEKVVEEVGELAKALRKKDVANAKEEAADVAIVLTHLVRGLGGSLFDEMVKKAEVNEERLKTGKKTKKARTKK